MTVNEGFNYEQYQKLLTDEVIQNNRKIVEGGIKYDEEKASLDLLDPDAMVGLAKVLDFGAKKYARDNWRGGIRYSRLIAAAMRHLFAILRGEYTDAESGLPHVDHAACCIMFLSFMMKNRTDLDDLWKKDSK